MRRIAVLAVLVLALAGSAAPAASAQGAPPAPPGPKPAIKTVPGVLAALRDAGAIDPVQHAAWSATWSRSGTTLKRLKGRRRIELNAVRQNVAVLARDGGLTASRAPLAFLTLERNRVWWASRPLLPNHRRVTFAPSDLVWQYYAGQGLQLQWLGTFGRANGLYLGRAPEAQLRRLLDETLALASQRAGGLAFESHFRFDGGEPPWVSGLSQGTGIQAFVRAGTRLGDARYVDAARQALGIFRTPPPAGVAVAGVAGTHFLQYSFAPSLRILNGFTQAVVGLHDFATLAKDDTGRALFASGEAELRTEMPAYDTGAWSRYAIPGREADLHYHDLVIEFLQNLCTRLERDASQGLGLPDATPYCAIADRFDTYKRTPPVIAVADAQARVGQKVTLSYQTSKVATVTVTLLRDGKAVLTRRARLYAGTQKLAVTPAKTGPLDIRIRAVDLAGNATTAEATLNVDPAQARRRR